MSRILRPRVRRWQILESIVAEHGWTSGVELGVLRGETFLHLLATRPDLSLTGIDLWRPMPEKTREPGGRSYEECDLEAYYARLIERAKTYGTRARLLRMDTAEAAREFADRSVDFVFIDADHTYEGASADIAAWTPKVRDRVVGHDYNPEKFPGVVRAVHEAFGMPELHPCDVWSVQVPH